jgi:hypothetical protein
LQNGNSGATLVTQTNSFGNYSFVNVLVGANYILSVSSKKYNFAEPSRVISVSEEVTNADFTGESF